MGVCVCVFNYVFQIFVFQLLDNSANKHAELPRFFSCFTSGSGSLAKYTKLYMVWQPNIRNVLLHLWRGLSVCLLVTCVSCAKVAEPIKMPFGAVYSCRVSTTPGNHGNLEIEILEISSYLVDTPGKFL